jgi:hypothetical protein
VSVKKSEARTHKGKGRSKIGEESTLQRIRKIPPDSQRGATAMSVEIFVKKCTPYCKKAPRYYPAGKMTQVDSSVKTEFLREVKNSDPDWGIDIGCKKSPIYRQAL